MIRIQFALLLTLPILAACEGQGPIDPSRSSLSSPTASGFAADPVRTAGGNCDTELTALAPLPGDPPNVLRLHIEYDCQLQHLGRTTAIAEQVVTFTGPTTAIASNITTYTAANGDELFSAWTGTSTNVGPDIAFSGTETYTGGTGRFVAASGTSWISGTASFVTNTGQFTSIGTISY